MDDLINLALMLMTMVVGACFWAFEALTGIQLFGVEVEPA